MGNPKRLNRRMHNKLWIGDNAAAVIGGRNLGAAYFDTSPHEGFSDLDLLVAGPVVREASISFDSYWNSRWAVPLGLVVALPADPAQALHDLDARATAYQTGEYVRLLRDIEFGRKLRYGPLPMTTTPAHILADPPTPDADAIDEAAGDPRTIFRALRAAVTTAQREVIMVTPYLVPSESGMGGVVLAGRPWRGGARAHEFARFYRCAGGAFSLRPIPAATAGLRCTAVRIASGQCRRHGHAPEAVVAWQSACQGHRHRPTLVAHGLDEPGPALAPAEY